MDSSLGKSEILRAYDSCGAQNSPAGKMSSESYLLRAKVHVGHVRFWQPPELLEFLSQDF